MNPQLQLSPLHALARVAGVAVMYVVIVAGCIHLCELALAVYRKVRDRRLLKQLVVETANAAKQLAEPTPEPPAIHLCPNCGEQLHGVGHYVGPSVGAGLAVVTGQGGFFLCERRLFKTADEIEPEGPPEEIGTGIYRLVDGSIGGDDAADDPMWL